MGLPSLTLAGSDANPSRRLECWLDCSPLFELWVYGSSHITRRHGAAYLTGASDDDRWLFVQTTGLNTCRLESP